MFVRLGKDKALDATRQTVKKLLSAQGEANAQSMAQKLIEQYEALTPAQQLAFFHHLAADFNVVLQRIAVNGDFPAVFFRKMDHLLDAVKQ